MNRIALALTAIISTAALATPAEARCTPHKGTIFCELTKSNTTLGTKRAFKNLGNNGFGPTFRITLEWMPEEPTEPGFSPPTTWCSLVVTYTADPTRNIGQISVAHTTTSTMTSDGESRFLTAGREALYIQKAGAWLTAGACSAGLSVTYSKNAARLFRN